MKTVACCNVAFKRIIELYVGSGRREQVVESRIVMAGCSDMVEHGGEERENVQFFRVENFQWKGDFQIVQAIGADVFRQDWRLSV